MAFDFLKLPKASQRAAFAHMSTSGKAKTAATPKPGAASKKMATPQKKKPSKGQDDPIRAARARLREQDKQNRDLSRTVQHVDGQGRPIGRISLEDAAVKMFGRKGAAARIAKANAKRRRK